MVKSLKIIFQFYTVASFHVALAVYALTQLTGIVLEIKEMEPIALFNFFGTVVAYNFVKYETIIRRKYNATNYKHRAIVVISLISFVMSVFYFLEFKRNTQLFVFVFALLTILYALPFFPNRKNARNWSGIKIYIVTVCWVGVTLLLPIIEFGLPFSTSMVLAVLQRWLLVFVLVLIFEIVDLSHDDLHLQTVPQQIGVRQTKYIGLLLMILFVGIEWATPQVKISFLVIKTGIALTVLLFLYGAQPTRSRYYTTFWVESIPIVWWWLVKTLA